MVKVPHVRPGKPSYTGSLHVLVPFFYHWSKENFKVNDDFAVCNFFFFVVFKGLECLLRRRHS